jgi:uncharacterized protein YbaR (Trm112 family)
MKAITHNLLFCNKNTCINNEKNFPLLIKSTKTENITLEKDDIRTKSMFEKLDKKCLNEWCKNLNVYKYDLTLPIEELEKNEDFYTYLHNILFEIQIVEGCLVCLNCHREYEIKNGIPDFVLKDDEL